MAENNQPNSTPQEPRRRFQWRLSRYLVLNYEKPESEAAQRRYERYRRFKSFYQRTKRKAYRDPRFVVEIAALCVVSAYTCFAGYQSCQMKRSVDQQIMGTRPVLYHNGVEWVVKPVNGELPPDPKVIVHWKNFGNSLAIRAVIAGGIFVRPSEQKAPISPDCNETSAVFPSDVRFNAIAPKEKADPQYGLAPNESLDNIDSEILYVSGCVYYYGIDGKKRYFSDICVKWVPKEAQDFMPCYESDRNYAH